MKYFLPVFVLLFSMSCKSIKDQPSPYEGKWLLVRTSGGFSGQEKPIDKEVILEIKNGKLTRTENGVLVLEAAFALEKGKVIETTEPADLLKSNSLIKQSITVDHDTLVLKDQCYDCYTHVYKKIK